MENYTQMGAVEEGHTHPDKHARQLRYLEK